MKVFTDTFSLFVLSLWMPRIACFDELVTWNIPIKAADEWRLTSSVSLLLWWVCVVLGGGGGEVWQSICGQWLKLCVDGRGFGGEAHCWFWVFYGVRFWLAVSVTKETSRFWLAVSVTKETSSRYACVCVWTRLFLDVNTQLEEKGKEDGQLQISHYMIQNSQQSLTTKIAGKLWNSAFHSACFCEKHEAFFQPMLQTPPKYFNKQRAMAVPNHTKKKQRL